MLSKSSRGEEVKKLQQMLRDAGHFKYKSNTGFFGDITDKALRDYQTAKGLKVDGQYGDVTGGVLPKDKPANDFLNMIKGAPGYAEMQAMYQAKDPRFEQAMNALQNPINAGQYAGGGVVITPEQLEQYKQLSTNEVGGYFDERNRFDTSGYNNNIDDISQTYDYNVKDLMDQASSAQNDLNNQEGNNGTWNTSARSERMNSLQNKFNNKANNMFNQTQNALDKVNTQREYNYGMPSVQYNPLTQFNTQLSQVNPANTSAISTTKYNPFGSLGGVMNKQKDKTIESNASQIKTSQYYNPFKRI